MNRYEVEAQRHWGILNDHLATRLHMLGDTCSMGDMAVWGWARAVPFILGAQAWESLPDGKRLLDEINTRPAAQRAEGLSVKHAFKTELDEEAKKAMCPQNARLVV